MDAANYKFKVGDVVLVAAQNPTGNPRTPKYIRGKRGIIGAAHGVLEHPRDHRGLYQPLYTVRFDLSEISPCPGRDSVWVDVHEEWLSAVQSEDKI